MLYLHIGLHKTGTTFLQQELFPKWKGIRYLAEDKLEYLTRMKRTEVYLLSREGLSGKNWMHADERSACIKNLSNMLPDAKILLSFRKHSGYIISSYTQYLQQGGYLPFEEYFDIEHDHGFMKIEDFLFKKKVDDVYECFDHLPFVILHEDILKDLEGLTKRIQGFIGGEAPDIHRISRRKHNKSVGYYPAKVLRYLNRISKSELNPNGKYDLYNWRFKRYGVDPRSLCQYRLNFLPEKSFISDSLRKSIDEYYGDDWAYVTRLGGAAGS